MSLNDKLIQALGLWRRKLLDLSKRNKALNFKPTKVTTVVIVDEQPGIVFKYLFTDGIQMKFIPILPSKNEITSEGKLQQKDLFGQDAFDDVEEFTNSIFQPYKVKELEDRHTDNLLQCNCTPEGLDTSLRRIDEILQSNLEEQGVHTLFLALGMLYYTESDSSQEVIKAPIVLLPVNIERKSARTGFVINAADDDPMVNPTLTEYLKQCFNISLPALPDFTDETNFDLQGYLSDFQKQIKSKTSWSLKNDIFLAHFTFQKFVMFKDIEKNSDSFKSHRLVKQLVTKQSTTYWGLPDEVREMDLDQEFPPEETFTVLDADSSQIRAIAAIAKGYDVVIEGPPGTGKSQTIVNIIAQALGQGKSVLFVSEKLAALQVVHRRLKESGLSEFCLELHSTKGNRKEVIDELRRALDSSLLPPPNAIKVSTKLKEVRVQLTQYVNEIHRKIEPLGLSVFEVYGKFGEVYDKCEFAFEGDVAHLLKDQVDNAALLLKNIVNCAQPLGQVTAHPWYGAKKTYYSQTDLNKIKSSSRAVVIKMNSFLEETRAFFPEIGLEEPILPQSFLAQSMLLETLLYSPHLPVSVLKEQTWIEIPGNLTHIINEGKKYQTLRSSLLEKFNNSVFDQEHDANIIYVEKLKTGFSKYIILLFKRYREIKRHWSTYLISKENHSISEYLKDLKLVDECRSLQFYLDKIPADSVASFGVYWKGSSSDWQQLSNVIKWIETFNSRIKDVKFNGRLFETAASNLLSPDLVRRLNEKFNTAILSLSDLCNDVGWPSSYFDQSPFIKTIERISNLEDNIDKGVQWAAFKNSCTKASNSIGEQFIKLVYNDQVSLIDIPSIFLRSVYQAWLDKAITDKDVLKEFNSLSHDEKVNFFRQIDEKVTIENRTNLITRMRYSAQERLGSPQAQEGMPHLRREFARQRRFSPLRKTITQSEQTIRAIKPCFLMSPLSVAQYLQGDHPTFDLVVFDEASQLPTEDAIGAICRGTQLIVVGDPKQLPPTNFFTLQSSIINSELDEQGNNVIEDTESVLEEFLSTGTPTTRLKWHYRSTNESLITFSNQTFYDSDLYTFPSCFTINGQSGLHFTYIPEGVYEGKGLNKAEAKAVVDAIVDHAKTNHKLSLGVGTFNMRQQLAILDEIEIRRRQDPSLEPFFDRGKIEPFFVKNLENIQGDERDVIFISVTFAKDIEGRLRYNFGPINNENGWRRLNVLITRARKKMIVFSSIKGDDISPAVTSSKGPQLIRDFLLFAEHGKIQSTSINKLLDTESPFEKDVMLEIMNHGFLADPQVGSSGYRIDLGIRHATLPGLYICGVECDGVSYHSSETARDRDRLRQAVLESRGWHIIRIWSTDWFKDREGQIKRIINFLENTRLNYLEDKVNDELKMNLDVVLPIDPVQEDLQEEVEKFHTPTYKRPLALPYKLFIFSDFENEITITNDIFIKALTGVVKFEGPIHKEFAKNRVCSFWWNRKGSRIDSALNSSLRTAISQNIFQEKEGFLYYFDQEIKVRNREGLKLTADFICPEEREEAINQILEAAKMLDRERLILDVIAFLGLVRNDVSKKAIDKSIKVLIDRKSVGEGSTGLALIK